jgi:hypothetical protein
MAEKWAGGEGLCQGRVFCAAKRSESLDTSRTPAMLLGVGIAEGNCALRRREYQIRFVL